MAVMERGVGFDRSLYKLPVLLLDDFADLTMPMLMQAYVETMYRALADQWEFERITPRWWHSLLNEVAATNSNEALLKLHPMSAVDEGFTRPLVPFDCEKMGGCHNR